MECSSDAPPEAVFITMSRNERVARAKVKCIVVTGEHDLGVWLESTLKVVQAMMLQVSSRSAHMQAISARSILCPC